MRLLVEISLYPLAEKYVEPILEFIERLNTHKTLEVKTSTTNTLVAGEYEDVMRILCAEMQHTHEEVGQAVFVCKFLNGTHLSID
ncbi:YkoF family thiamine/hydroxymethylpyrimidine-binding protein [Ningiella sp. W23]|uniref:YkoF family thiamine/hydroxymethylpyrimidine-binding protein n=1 Tax=Ningiella sp. W23 TaxID=3023715 RepID=UPI0037566271